MPRADCPVEPITGFEPVLPPFTVGACPMSLIGICARMIRRARFCYAELSFDTEN